MAKISMKLKRIIFFILTIIIISLGTILLIDNHVKNQGSKYIMSPQNTPEVDAILVLGAGVYSDGTVCPMLKDRLDTALAVYDKNASTKFLVSGDHGQVNYNEVKAMKNYLLKNGIKSENIFMDHAGFSTYESIYRAKDIFEVKKVTIVTQEYHLMRAVYTARKLGLQAYGVSADKQNYPYMPHYKNREIAARCKDFVYVNILKPEPKYLGESIPISGDGNITDDEI